LLRGKTTTDGWQEVGGRILGLTSVLWNLPRSVTLAAGPEGCKLLLVKRIALRSSPFNKSPALRPWNREQFWSRKVPRWLADNRLFDPSPVPGNLRGFLRAVAAADAAPGDEPVQLLHYDRGFGQRLRVVCARAPNPGEPLPDGECADEADPFVSFREKEAAGGLYFVLTGMVRLTRLLPGGRVIVNQLGPKTFFGPACVDDTGKATVTAEAVADSLLLRLNPAAVKRLCERFESARVSLQKDAERQADRDKAVKDARHLPPYGMSEETAAKLLLATDLLRIDLDLCARCDECVVNCVCPHPPGRRPLPARQPQDELRRRRGGPGVRPLQRRAVPSRLPARRHHVP